MYPAVDTDLMPATFLDLLDHFRVQHGAYLSQASGKRPVGFRAPRAFSQYTLDVIKEQ